MHRALLLGIPLAFLASACTYDNGDARRYTDPSPANSPTSCGPSVESTIDSDGQIEVQAGEGAGVFIEYTTGGHWQLRTTCDTLKNNVSCKWDIIVTPQDGETLSNVLPTDLESTDDVRPFPDDTRSYQLVAETSGDTDGFSFDSAPGAAISVDTLLDDRCALPFFFWIGDGALHKGSPSNPVVLIPSSQ